MSPIMIKTVEVSQKKWTQREGVFSASKSLYNERVTCGTMHHAPSKSHPQIENLKGNFKWKWINILPQH